MIELLHQTNTETMNINCYDIVWVHLENSGCLYARSPNLVWWALQGSFACLFFFFFKEIWVLFSLSPIRRKDQCEGKRPLH